MTDRRSVCIALAAALAVAASTAWAADDGDRPFGGVVVDPLGNAIAAVEVFLVPERRADPDPVPVLTDHDGRYLVRHLVPGAYRIVAVKEGFGVYVDRVHTSLRSTFDVVLHPLPRENEGAADEVPDDATWALRVPRRSIWQDVAPAPVQPIPVVFDASRSRDPVGFADLLEGRIDQSFAVAVPSSEGWNGGVQGSETNMALAGNIGGRTRVEVGGRYASLDSGADDPAARSAMSSRDEAAFNVDVRYQGSTADRIDIKAFWASSDAFVASAATVAEPLRQEDRVWGYEARWTRQLRDGSSLMARTEYSEAMLTLPDGDALGGWLGDSFAVEPRRHRAIGTGGAYERRAGRDHQARVEFDARFVDSGLPGLRFASDGAPMARLDRAGWEIEARTGDLWTPGGPLSWEYGLDYRHRVGPLGESAVAIPRAGAVWSGSWATMRVELNRPISTVPREGVEAVGSIDAASGEIGYEATIDAALPLGLHLRGGAAYAPSGTSSFATGPSFGSGRNGDRPLFVLAGDAVSQERSVSLRRDIGAVVASIDWIRGEVSGSLAPVLPYGLPFHALRPTRADYRVGRIGVRIPSTGTQIQLERRQVVQAPTPEAGPDRGADPLAQQGLELRILQDMLRYPGSAWRLLVSLESAEVGEAEVEYVSRLEGERLPDAVHRVNAGVSVAF